MPSFPSQLEPGAFIPTTYIWDVDQLLSIEVTDPEFKELLVRLYQNINNMALVLNIKDSAYYSLTEFVNGQAFFPNPALSSTTAQMPTFRQVFRKVINFGALPNTATKNVPHGLTITNTFTFTRIYGTASDTVAFSYIPLPFASPVLVENIKIEVNATDVLITTGSDRTNYTTCYVILEYLKN